MSSKSNNQGRAYEFACLRALYDAVSALRPAQIVTNGSYDTAQAAWETLTGAEKTIFAISAQSATATLFAMEPNIVEPTDDTLNLYIQSDRHGEEADVRDIIIERKDIIWEIGLSIKHNHLAVKHSRLAKTLDFGEKWYGVNCSDEYWSDVKPIFNFLEEEKSKGNRFKDLDSKEDDVYVPLLNAFIREVTSQISKDKTIPLRFVEYVLGRYDFYKVISVDSKRVTTISSFNMYGTLNKRSRAAMPSIKIPRINLPSTLLYMGFKPESKTTVLLCFDNGWQFSFRIHNAKDEIEPSLKFDMRISGMPPDVNIKYNCKWQD